MADRKYSSTRSAAARKIAAAQLPCACFRCGRIVTADMQWNADHPTARVHAEAMGIPEHEQDRTVVPSHRTCDAKAGAKLGNEHRAKIKAEPRRIPRVDRPSLVFPSDVTRVPLWPLQLLSPATAEDPTGATECPL